MFLHLSVSHSVHGGCLYPSMHHRSHDQGISVQGVSVLSGLCPGVCVWGGSVQEVSVQRGSLSRGDLCPEGVSVQRDLCPGDLCPEWVSIQGVSFQGDFPQTETPPYGNAWAVRIPLEYIFVEFNSVVSNAEYIRKCKCMYVKRH